MKNTIVHTFVVITQGEGKPGDLQYRNLFSTRNPEEVEELSRLLLERNAGFRRESMSRNSREIVVTHVDPAEHEKYLLQAGRNGLKSQPVKRGMTFPSGTAASGHVGLRHNEVAMMLSRAAFTGEKVATIRGVTFAYKDDAGKK